MIIYEAHCRTSRKSYVGKTTTSIENRWKCHVTNAYGRHRNKNLKISNAIRVHGADSFELRVLQHCETLEELSLAEIAWIIKLNTFSSNGYNMTAGGEGIHGYRHTDETKHRMRERWTETHANRPKRVVSDETKLKLSAINKNRKVTDETRAKMSEAQRRRHAKTCD